MIGQTLHSTAKGYKLLLQSTEQAIKDIKNQSSQTNNRPAEFMQTETSAILEFMSQPKAYEHPAYARSMLVLDNLLVMSKELSSCIWLHEQFLSNLSKHFCRISKSSSDSEE